MGLQTTRHTLSARESESNQRPGHRITPAKLRQVRRWLAAGGSGINCAENGDTSQSARLIPGLEVSYYVAWVLEHDPGPQVNQAHEDLVDWLDWIGLE